MAEISVAWWGSNTGADGFLALHTIVVTTRPSWCLGSSRRVVLCSTVLMLHSHLQVALASARCGTRTICVLCNTVKATTLLWSVSCSVCWSCCLYWWSLPGGVLVMSLVQQVQQAFDNQVRGGVFSNCLNLLLVKSRQAVSI